MADGRTDSAKTWAERFMGSRRNAARQARGRALIDALWRDYLTLNPHAKSVHGALVSQGQTPVNDHIAFRTFDVGRAGLRVIARQFEELGWTHGGNYDIKEKKVTAVHLNPPPMSDLPKVFISELRTDEFSPDIRQIIYGLVRMVPEDHVEAPDFLFSGAPWGAIPYRRYLRLANAKDGSEYAAWVAAFGYRANHFTVLANALTPPLNDLRHLNAFIKSHGHELNASGGEIKGSPEQFLEQSSTMAGKVPVQFTDGIHLIPACYYEFAKRHPLTPNGLWFQGFVESSATRIFDSTSALPGAAPTSAEPPAAATNGMGRDKTLLYLANTQNGTH